MKGRERASGGRSQGARAQALLRAFLGFALVSGVGWLLDFLAFTALAKAAGRSPFEANFVSSWVGVTFVWFVSLRLIFGAAGRTSLLAVFWGCQLASILAYSQVLALLASELGTTFGWVAAVGADIAAKIILTPINLLTNFVLMKSLTRFAPELRRGG